MSCIFGRPVAFEAAGFFVGSFGCCLGLLDWGAFRGRS